MAGASCWYAIMAITIFLMAIWFASRASRLLGISSIILEVAVGILLGPGVAGLLPSELSVCYIDKITDCSRRYDQVKIAHRGTEFCDLGAYLTAGKYAAPGATWDKGFWGVQPMVTLDNKVHCVDPNDASCQKRRLDDGNRIAIEPRRLKADGTGKTDFPTYDECLVKGCELNLALECATVPNVFTLVGHAGVGMMIFESGMHFDFVQAKTVGPWASAVAVIGTLLPAIAGAALSMAFGFDFFPDGLAAGVALSPTSIGIALKLLREADAMQTYFGQAVMTAAFVDDVLALILFSILFSLGDEITPFTFLPLIAGCVFMAVAVWAAVAVWPPFITWMFSKIPETKADSKLTRHDEVMWFLMLVTLCVYAQITHLCGTHLWGCFIAGMCFSTQHRAHHVWVRQVKRYTCWWLRIFFGCTLAWSIPIEELFSLEAFWKGTLMGIGPCVLAKVVCAPFMGEARWVIGWAMVGRAEFAYFIAIMAKSVKMMDDKLFAILIWALIYATIFAPLIFRNVLARYMAKQQGSDASPKSLTGAGPARRASKMFPDLPAEAEQEAAARQRSKISQLTLALATKSQQLECMNVTDSLREAAKNNKVHPETSSGEVVSESSGSAIHVPQAHQAAAGTGALNQFTSLMAADVSGESQELPGGEMPIGQIKSLLVELQQEQAHRSIGDDAQPFIEQAISLSIELIQAREATSAAESQKKSDAGVQQIADLQAQLSAMNQQCDELRQSQEQADEDHRISREALLAKETMLEQQVVGLRSELVAAEGETQAAEADAPQVKIRTGSKGRSGSKGRGAERAAAQIISRADSKGCLGEEQAEARAGSKGRAAEAPAAQVIFRGDSKASLEEVIDPGGTDSHQTLQ